MGHNPSEPETVLLPDVAAAVYLGAALASFCRRICHFLFCPPPAERHEAEIISIKTRARKAGR